MHFVRRGTGAEAHGSRERGQVTTAIVLSVTVGLVAVALFGLVALARGADERTKSQSAADAAALAGADALNDLLPGLFAQIGSKHGWRDVFGCGLGRGAAADFASRNDATLTDYCFDVGDDEVRVRVRMNDPVTDDVGPATAKATARTGLDLGHCDWDDEEPPTPSTTSPSTTPTSSPSPTTTEPPPDYGTTLRCHGVTVRFVVDGETGKLTLDDIDFDPFKARLKH